MSFNLIPAAMAAQTAAEQGPSTYFSMVLIAIFIIIFYFLFIRPQTRRAKEQKALLAGIQTGDEVVTTGGIIGKVTKIKDEFVVLAINENVEIKMQKASIASTLPKGTIKSIG
ncbi:MAG: preprotein translocase subunit YajC [Pseudomonadota bacterium]